MSAVTAVTAVTAVRARVAEHLEAPVARAGLALVSSAGLTSVLGLAYWAVAARRYSPAAVGACAALLAAMEVVAAVANLGLRTALIRFVPAMGERAPRVVALSYAVAGAVAVVGAGLFVLVHRWWFPELTLLDGVPGGLFFVVSTGLWVVFMLQDSVLVGVRKAGWVPVENTAYAMAKLVLLVALTGAMPTWGVYVSWSLPLLVVVLGVNGPLFARVLPHARGPERLTVADLVRFSAGDFAASAFWLATIDVLPLLVLALAGAEASAYYALSWTVAYTLFLVTSSVGSAVIAESAHDPAGLADHARRAMTQALTLVLPAAAVVVLGAPLLLQVFGPDYAAEATPLLRLIAASAVPQVAIGISVAVARAERRIREVVVLYAVLCSALVFLATVLTILLGVVGVGVAWLVVQSAAAVYLLLTRLRVVWVEAVPTRVLRALGRARNARARRRWHRDARAVAPGIVARLQSVAGVGDVRAVRTEASRGDEVLLVIEHDSGAPVVAKVPLTGHAEAGRRREHHLLETLGADERLGHWRAILPKPVASGSVGAHSWFGETSRGTVDGSDLLPALGVSTVVEAGVSAIGPLHETTASITLADDDLLRVLVDDAVDVVATALPAQAEALTRMADELRAGLRGRILSVARTHGDFHPGNLLWSGPEGVLCGVVDWVASRPQGLPEIDALTLSLAATADAAGRELGSVVADRLDGAPSALDALVLARVPSASVNDGLAFRTLVLLVWLHHVAANLDASGTYAANRVWVVRNVEIITRRFAPPAEPPVLAPPAEPPVLAPPAEPPVLAPPAEPPVLAANSPVGRRESAAGTGERRVRSSRTGGSWTALAALAVVGAGLWWLGFARVDPRQIGDVGAAPELPTVAWLGLAMLVVAFGANLASARFRSGLAGFQVLALAACLHGAPIVAYGTARYAWAWKHVGVVDYFARHSAPDPSLDVYQNWPGFFAGAQALVRLTGLGDAVTIARWAPLGFGLLTAAAVAFLLGALTDDRRIVWGGAWFAVMANWVGQEYFAPQAAAFFLCLVALGLALRFARPRVGTDRRSLVVLGAVVLLALAVASSHQLTPIMLTVALAGLAVVCRARVGALALVVAVFTVGWAVWVADYFVGRELVDELTALSDPVSNAGATLDRGMTMSRGQALVSSVARGLVLVIGGLVVVGLVRWWRAGERDRVALWLLVAPGLLLLGNSFGGEILFRVLLFASPLLGFFAAWAVLGREPRWWTAAAVAGVSSLLLVGFAVAHYGKDGYYVFSEGEVAAAAFVAEHAPDGSALVEGSRNYPNRFRNYERFRYVTIEREEWPDQERIARAPVAVLHDWLTDPRDAAGYLLITRSQKEEAAALGSTPPGLLDDIEAALRSSRRFEVVYENPDAVVFTAVPDGRDEDR